MVYTWLWIMGLVSGGAVTVGEVFHHTRSRVDYTYSQGNTRQNGIRSWDIYSSFLGFLQLSSYERMTTVILFLEKIKRSMFAKLQTCTTSQWYAIYVCMYKNTFSINIFYNTVSFLFIIWYFDLFPFRSNSDQLKINWFVGCNSDKSILFLCCNFT